MIEFISLCVCSACLSCLCCLITGGLCIIPATVRLRNKLVEKHLPEDMQWLGNLSPSEVCESDSTSSSQSDCYPVSRDSPKDRRSSRCDKLEEISARRTRECSCLEEAKSAKGDRKNCSRSAKSVEKSKPKRWTFCYRFGRSTVDSGECCMPGEEGEKDEEIEGAAEEPEPKFCTDNKKRKKSRIRKNDSETYCAYFKSCSCTDVKESRKKWRRKKLHGRSETSSKCPPPECFRDKRRSKARRKSRTCPKNCQCKIIAENKKSANERDREIERCAKCGKRTNFKTRCCTSE